MSATPAMRYELRLTVDVPIDPEVYGFGLPYTHREMLQRVLRSLSKLDGEVDGEVMESGYIDADGQPLPVAPEKFRDVTEADKTRLCACDVQFQHHYDGWDGNRLDCNEARRRNPVEVTSVQG